MWLQTQLGCLIIHSTRAAMREQINRHNRHHGPERTMNQINAEVSVIEAEISERQNLFAIQAEDAITELSLTQLMMVGGGGQIILD